MPSFSADVGPIVETGSLHFAVVHREPDRLDDMQRSIGCGRKPSDIAGVRRDLWFDQSDVQCHQSCSGYQGSSTAAGMHFPTRVGPQTLQLVQCIPIWHRESLFRPAVPPGAPNRGYAIEYLCITLTPAE